MREIGGSELLFPGEGGAVLKGGEMDLAERGREKVGEEIPPVCSVLF